MFDKSSIDKDAIIEKQTAEIKMLKEYVKVLEQKKFRYSKKKRSTGKNSSNSSKPPSSDIVKPPKILRRFGRKRKCGGQHGHTKFSRRLFEPGAITA